ncbi:30S ribosomal protein S6e [Candidatus Micrarchaeota archaeon]|nr:30S ribosomal protein S6e [Candidatus Micrarchaeota archaeon]MBI5176709.1 30S ribosomal protein S6e [Candidatus Micrarchaeota archaeon]
MKIIANDVKNGVSFQKEVPKEKEGALAGKHIGEKLDGGIIGMTGYTLQITGGSDNAGFPMRKDVPGQKRQKVYLTGGTGAKHVRHGNRIKKIVSGNTIGTITMQVNAKIAEYGPTPLAELGFAHTPKSKEEKEKAKAEKAAAAPKPKKK